MNTIKSNAIRGITGAKGGCEAASPSVNAAHTPGEIRSSPPRSGATNVILGERYRLVRVIGEGGMGVVWEAEQVELGSSVAIKILAEDACTPSAAARFEREALAASRIEHPSVVRVLDFGRLPSGVPFLVMEHLAGETLEEVLERRGTLPLGEACEWLRPIASALDAAHATGIVHRDVKPANILATPTLQGPRVTLIDFGLAVRPGWDRLTGPGAILGTPAYLAPEAAAGRPTDARADVYSLGCVLFRILTGRAPHERKTIVATLVAKLSEPAARLSDVSAEPFPAALEELLARTLSTDPELRPATAGQLVMELVRIAEGRTRSAPADVTPIETPAIERPATERPAIAATEHIARPRGSKLRSALPIACVAPLATASDFSSGAARLRGCRLTVARCATIALVAAALALVTFFAWSAGADSTREPLAKSALPSA